MYYFGVFKFMRGMMCSTNHVLYNIVYIRGNFFCQQLALFGINLNMPYTLLDILFVNILIIFRLLYNFLTYVFNYFFLFYCIILFVFYCILSEDE